MMTLYPPARIREAFGWLCDSFGFRRESNDAAYHPDGRASLSLAWDFALKRWRLLFWDWEHGSDWLCDFWQPERSTPA